MTRLSRRLTPVFLVPTLTAAFGVAGAAAQGWGPPLSECAAAVGTYLTTNYGQDASAKFVSRSLISLTDGGHAFLTDSGEGGGAGFGPFSDARGAWRCVSREGDVARFAATVLDFTFVTPANPEQLIGRLDIDGSIEAGKLSGTMTLYLLPLGGDPLNAAGLKEAAAGKFEAQRVVAP